MTQKTLPALTLVLGGARSGKSRLAESLCEGVQGPLIYIATAEAERSAGDGEMAARIQDHQARRGPRWQAHEAPLDLPGALLGAANSGAILIDCLTLWLSNLMAADRDLQAETARLLAAVKDARVPVVLVSNEVGLGIVPMNALARAFRDEAGRLNQTIAGAADQVIFVAAGLPLYLKGGVQ